MPRKAQPWFRWYVEAFGDGKMRRLTPAQRWLFVAMCGAGKQSPELGRLLVAPGVGMTDQEVADYAGVPVRDVVRALPTMAALNMVRRDEEGVLVVLNLPRRQFSSDTSAERTATYRDRHSDNVVTSQPRHEGRHSDVRSDVPDTETETEAENPPSLRSAPPGADHPPEALVPTPRPDRRGTRLPDDWIPPPDDVAWARHGYPWLTSTDLQTIHAEFGDYWHGVPGARGRKLDWPATWRNRVRDQAPRYRNRTGNRQPSGVDWEQAAEDARRLDEARGIG